MQKSPIIQTIFCRWDLNFKEPTNRSHPIGASWRFTNCVANLLFCHPRALNITEFLIENVCCECYYSIVWQILNLVMLAHSCVTNFIIHICVTNSIILHLDMSHKHYHSNVYHMLCLVTLAHSSVSRTLSSTHESRTLSSKYVPQTHLLPHSSLSPTVSSKYDSRTLSSKFAPNLTTCHPRALMRVTNSIV